MRNGVKTGSRALAILAGIGCIFGGINVAHAQDFHLRLEPGATVAITDPQATTYDTGISLAVKPEWDIKSWLGAGPVVQAVYLPAVDNSNAGVTWDFGAFLRVKRPHNLTDDGSGDALVSPWIDGVVSYERTGDVNRPHIGAAVGAELGSFNRTLWLGPFLRYDHTFNWHEGNLDTREVNMLTAGLSFDIDFHGRQTKYVNVVHKVEHVKYVMVETTITKTVPAPAEKACPNFQMNEIVQFPYDSALLDNNAKAALNRIIAKLGNLDKAIGAGHVLKIEGHASSEGQVEHNRVLSMKRAVAVVDYLVAHGVPRNRLAAGGFGVDVPVADNRTQHGRELNRRAEFVVSFTSVAQQ